MPLILTEGCHSVSRRPREAVGVDRSGWLTAEVEADDVVSHTIHPVTVPRLPPRSANPSSAASTSGASNLRLRRPSVNC